MSPTFYLIGIVLLILLTVWLVRRALRRNACCGTCGCNVMSEKAKKKMLEKRKKRAAQRKAKR